MMKKYISFIVFFLFLFMGNMYGQVTSLSDTKEKQGVVDNSVLNDAVHMYPNPVGNILTIESKIPVSEVQIYSLLGQLVKKIDTNFKNIYLADLNPGIYMIKIHSGKNSITKKLIKR